MDGNLTYLEGLGEGKVTATSFNQFTSSYTTGSFTGSFKGDGSGLTGIPGVTPIDTTIFVTTSSFNSFTSSYISDSGSFDSRITNLSSSINSITGSVTINTSSFVTTSSFNSFTSSYTTGSFTGLFTGDGSRLTDVTASIDTGSLVTISTFNLFTSSYNTGSFTGSFVGDGSGLTGIPGVTPIATGSFATTGSNTFIGNQIITGSINISGSISQVGVGLSSTVFGFGSGTCVTTGTHNTFYGNEAGCRVTIGQCNTMIGTRAGACNVQGSDNTIVGFQAGIGNTACASMSNTVIGACAGRAGQQNTVLGAQAASDTTGQQNTILGYFAHRGSNSNCTIAIGSSAGTRIGGSGAANCSIFIGTCTGAPASGQCNQIVIGHCSTGNGSNTTTIGNTSTTATHLRGRLIASGSISQVGIGEGNTILGDRAGAANITGGGSGDYNTFIGAGAGSSNTFGRGNLAIGPDALGDNILGDSNLSIGSEAGKYSEGFQPNPTVNESVFIGNGTAAKSSGQTNQIVIGNWTTGNGSNTVTIGNDSIISTHLKGTLNVTRQILSEVSSSLDFVDDLAAASGGVPLGGLYHTSGSVKIRLA